MKTSLLLLSLVVVSRASATLFLVDSTNTYLHAFGENPFPTIPINLAANGYSAGQTVIMSRVGSFNRFGGGTPTDYGMSALFSTSNVLLPPPLLNRVPGAINIGQNWVSPVTSIGGQLTDIPEDFLVCNSAGTANGITVVIPTGAQWVFASAIDDFFSDNNNTTEFYLQIQVVPEPSCRIIASAGLIYFWIRKKK